MKEKPMKSCESAKPAWLVGFYLIFTILAFSSIEIIANPIRNQVSPMLITFWRFAIGSIFLLPLIFFRRQTNQLNRIELLKLFGLGVLNIIISMGAHAVCMKHAKASTAAILIAANPIATNFFAWLILREAMPMRRIIALAVGLSGIVMIAARPDNATDTTLGIAAGIVAMFGFGLYTVLSKGMVAKHGSVKVTTLSCLTALAAYIPILLIKGQGLIPDTAAWPRLLTLGIFGSGLGYVTFFKALEAMPAGKASYLFFFKPPVALLLAWMVLGEKPALAAIIGTTLIMSGIFIETFRRK